MKIEEEFLMLLAEEGEKEPFSNMPEHSVLNRTCPQERLPYQSLIY